MKFYGMVYTGHTRLTLFLRSTVVSLLSNNLFEISRQPYYP